MNKTEMNNSTSLAHDVSTLDFALDEQNVLREASQNLITTRPLEVLLVDGDLNTQELISALLEEPLASSQGTHLWISDTLEGMKKLLIEKRIQLDLVILDELLVQDRSLTEVQSHLPGGCPVILISPFKSTQSLTATSFNAKNPRIHRTYKPIVQQTFLQLIQTVLHQNLLNQNLLNQNLLNQNLLNPATSTIFQNAVSTPSTLGETPSSQLAKFTTGQHTLLIVDDNDINIELLSEALHHDKRHLLTATNGKDALNIAKSQPVDLILLDIMMPEMDGYEVLHHLRQDPETHHTPVILISALDQTQHIVQAFAMGVQDYITKPFQMEEVKARVSAVLDLKDAKTALEIERDKLNQVFHFSQDGLALMDSDFRLIVTNPAFDQFFPVTDLLHQSSPHDNPLIFQRIFAGSIEPHTSPKAQHTLSSLPEQFSRTRLNGTNQHFQCQWTYIPQGTGQPPHYMVMVRDITQETILSQRKETFVATLTHDLKTPIRAEIRALTLLKSGHFGSLSDTQREVLEEIIKSSQFMDQMVDGLLTSYRYEDGEVILNKEPVHLNSFLADIIRQMTILAEEKNQTLILETSQDLSETVLDILIDKLEMKRVFQNLIQNAIAYTQPGGTITLSHTQEKVGICIQVKDNGKGIEADLLPYLFDRYFSQSKRFRQVGTGLGLYLCKQIVEAHFGQITVISELERGTCFEIRIPSQTHHIEFMTV
jgi:signal transduction histidine kinase/CheY-like chemotaxis protein